MSEPTTTEQVETYICINCPIGCPLRLVHEGAEIREVSGQQCNRGAKYARQEFVDPRRAFATTIPIRNARYPRLPVKITAPLPKDQLLAAVDAIHALTAEAPVTVGQVLAADLLGHPGVNVVATRTLKRV